MRPTLCVIGLLMGVASGMITGCARVTSGYAVKPATIAFIELGTTTRDDILDNLGNPSINLEQNRLFAYVWVKSGATQVTALEGGGSRGLTFGPSRTVKAFCLAFDETGLLLRYETVVADENEWAGDTAARWYHQTAVQSTGPPR